MRPRIKPEVAALAALAYVPFLFSSPGRVSADSNQGLYLDPGGVVTGSVDLWDPHIGAGTVPHQRLGYLFPTGPWFWLLDVVGVPDWIAQRLWWGTLTFVAALGVRWLLHVLGLSRAAALSGALVYACTPYQLAFTARMSVLLLPWAALPWLVGWTMRASRVRGWRAPAAAALVLVLVGGVNASSLVFVVAGPALWLLIEAFRGRAPAQRALAAGVKIAALGLGVSLWWLVGLRLQGRYGLPVLQLTENGRTVAEVSSPAEVLRGLGNWFFYGRDRTGYSLDQAADYASRWSIVSLATLVVPAAALLAAPLLRWVHLRFFALLVVGGTVIAVGSWPPDAPSPYGRLWEAFGEQTAVGLALRNTPRAVPLVVLGIAGIVAAAVCALPTARWRGIAVAGLSAVVLTTLLPVARYGHLTDGHERDEHLAPHWLDAAAALDAGDRSTRVLEVPGVSFAAYEWGTTVDPVTPWLIERPYLAREVLPQGGRGTANLLDALDRRMQHGTLEPSALAPVARLLAAGTVVLRGDLEQRGRFDTPPPEQVWHTLRASPGLAAPVSFGSTPTERGLPAVALFDVDGPRPVVRTASAHRAVVLAGDGDGIVDAAAAGLLDGRSLVLQSAALDERALDAALDRGAHLVVTDTNRRRSQTWFYALRDTRGPTEPAGATAPDPTGYDYRLDPFPGSSDRERTVVEQVGGQVSASREGGPERPEDRAAHAVDGDPATAWRVSGPHPEGAALTIVPDVPVATSTLRLVQPTSARDGRGVGRVRLHVGNAEPVDVTLDERSLEPPGQAVALPVPRVARLSVEILETTPARLGGDQEAPVGLAEVRLGDVRITEVVRPPLDLLGRVGDRAREHGLDVVLTRLGRAPGDGRVADEPRLRRRVDLPQERTFTLAGTISVAPTVGAIEGPATCRSDLLVVDAEAVPVRLTSIAEGAVTYESCSPVSLTAGPHRIDGAASAAGLTVDRVVLSSAPNGEAADIAVRGGGVKGAPPVRILDDDASRLRLEVAAPSEPFWLVLAQSSNDGWRAEVHDGDAAPRQMVDGYANGWLITPDRRGPLEVVLEWEPQRQVRWGLLASSVVLALVLLILLQTRRRSMPRALLHAPLSFGPPVSTGTTQGLLRAVAVAAAGITIAPWPVVSLAIIVIVVSNLWRSLWWLPGPAAVAALLLGHVGARPSLAWVGVLMLGWVVVSAELRPAASRAPAPES